MLSTEERSLGRDTTKPNCDQVRISVAGEDVQGGPPKMHGHLEVQQLGDIRSVLYTWSLGLTKQLLLFSSGNQEISTQISWVSHRPLGGAGRKFVFL